MAKPKKFTVPTGTHQSIGIELEFLVAWLPNGEKDPHESEAHNLPPLLRIDADPTRYPATVDILMHIRETLERYGIPVSNNRRPSAKELAATKHIPRRLRDVDKWSVGLDSSVEELVNKDYVWQPIEIRSPALWATPESYEQIRCVINLLKSCYRLRVNPTCGFHVHVGNGWRYFKPEKVKKTAAFLWASDPLLSRLHPPWRRANGYSASIRLESRLAYEGTAEEIREELERIAPVSMRLPITAFSDITQEVEVYGSEEGWAKYAHARKEVGPFMTLSTDVNHTGDTESEGSSRSSSSNKNNSNSNSSHRSTTGSSTNSSDNGGGDKNKSNRSRASNNSNSKDHDSDNESTRSESPEILELFSDRIRELLEQEQNAGRVPPDLDTLDRNIGLVHWNKVEDPRIMRIVLYLCERLYGHRNPAKLKYKEQLDIMLQAQCQFLYGHIKVKTLDWMEILAVLNRCGPYVEAGRSSYVWDPDIKNWEPTWFNAGRILDHPKALKDERIDGPMVVNKFHNIAKLLDLNEEGDDDDGIEYINREEYEKAMATNGGIEKLVKELREYADSPNPDDFSVIDLNEVIVLSDEEDEVDEVDEIYPDETPAPVDIDEDGINTVELTPDDSVSPPVMPSKSRSAPPTLGEPKARKDSSSSSSSSEFSNTPRDSTGGNGGGGGSSPTPPPPTRNPSLERKKLQPDEIEDLPESYQEYVKNHLQVSTLSWIPADPATATATAASGLRQLTLCESAAEVADLITGRPNYNFLQYQTSSMHGVPESLRTIEFREASGTLDASWIVTYARICEGILRWCRNARMADYIRVLDRVMLQNERDERRHEARKSAAFTYDMKEEDERNRYDVCDLLEDIGLYAEAEFVRKREKENGPPR
ncbi:putative amidoligase enzyme-domain-containing protein [Hypoxylon trugodes]|uniref:putative amidoligase enzyme-domain-containing protein n=1 Tax=Hypoxylon trugodes TaxID=326681 RepID=UPI00219DD868|nr:putative amidoligase enzyme-domain-containing protein [Hypoxylon trugodes]KAI1383356.1 putative amidoligase enzyme-domain-containing protein [Hypoxylon trugodes]